MSDNEHVAAIREIATQRLGSGKYNGDRDDIIRHAEAMATQLAEARAEIAGIREKLLDPEIAHDIASEMFMHGYEDELSESDTVPPIALGVVIGRLFNECHICAENEVRRRLGQSDIVWHIDANEVDAPGGTEGER